MGESNVNIQELFFGEFHEAGIDQNGGVNFIFNKKIYIWKKKPLYSYADANNKDNERENIINLEKEGFKSVKFTKGFIWALNKKGEVYQWPLERKINEYKEVEDCTVVLKKRKINTLPSNIQ